MLRMNTASFQCPEIIRLWHHAMNLCPEYPWACADSGRRKGVTHLCIITVSVNATATRPNAVAVNVVQIIFSHVIVAAKTSLLVVQIPAVEKYARLAVRAAGSTIGSVPGAHRTVVSPCPRLSILLNGGYVKS